MSTDKVWQDIKEDYLCRVEAALMMTDKVARQNILKDVEEHLDRRFTELTPDCRNRQEFEAIITDMGPAEDYAELLASKNQSHGSEYIPPRNLFFLNRLMTVLFIVVLFCVVGWKISTGSILDGGQQSPAIFENDPELTGRWVSVDFVQHPDAFTPEHRQRPDNLPLKEMAFYDNGTTSGPWEWTKGDIYCPGDDSHANYQIRQINGREYLFWEWISGDVLIRGEKPGYYVLQKEK
jgi:hypothetical protein